ncbi:MAG: RES family NAD+ phosphorylase [Solirubrobacterales bacterium]
MELPSEFAVGSGPTSAEALAALDLPAAEPIRAQWPAFQDVGERLHAAGCEGVLYRSAARSGGLCLCVFRATPTDIVGRLEPLPPPRRVSRPPTPPHGLRT